MVGNGHVLLHIVCQVYDCVSEFSHLPQIIESHLIICGSSRQDRSLVGTILLYALLSGSRAISCRMFHASDKTIASHWVMISIFQENIDYWSARKQYDVPGTVAVQAVV